MPHARRSKTNTLYFSDIPKQDAWKNELWSIMRELYRLREERTVLVQQSREMRKRTYNFSLQINELQKRQDHITMKYIINKNGQE